MGKWRGLDDKIFRKVWVPFEEPCFLKYVASKEDPLPQQLSWVGGERKEESHLAPDNAISTQGRFLPTDVNPQLQSQLLAMTAAGLQTGGETSPYSEQENGVARDYKNGTRPCMKQTAPYSVGANGVSALELLGLSQQEQTEPCNTNLQPRAQSGKRPMRHTERFAAKTTTSRPVGHDACIEHTDATAGHKDQPSGSSEDTDGVLAIAVLTAPYSVGANGVTSQMLSLAPATSQMLSSAPATTGITTPFFGDTGIRLLQFLVEFHPGGVPSHGLASRDEGHSAAAI